MRHDNDGQATGGMAGLGSKKTLLLGVAGTLAAAAWFSLAARERQKARRFADRDKERRNPMNLFIAGNFPQRRKIDRNGAHPLFERRQSVYDAY